MDAMMTIQVQTTSKATVPTGADRRGAGDTQGSFAEYMDKKINETADRKKLLGVDAKAKKADKSEAPVRKSAEADKEGKDRVADDAQSVVAMLSQFINELEDMAKDSDRTPGDWTFTLPDNGLIQQIAESAGMDENELAALLKQYEDQDGVIDLRNFIASLTRHFEDQKAGVEVTVPETELPFFETLLSKMGVPVEQIVDVADMGATGDGRLDLTAFLNGLQEVQGNDQAIVLSDLEVARMREILAEAGVGEELQNDLLPPVADLEMPFSLDRLRQVLQQGIAEVKESTPKLDLPSFLSDLQQVFDAADFNKQSVGWTPAVQDAISSAYEELLKSVDMSTVQVKVVQSFIKPQAVENDDAAMPQDVDGDDVVKPQVVKNDESGKPVVVEHNESGKPVVVEHNESGKPVVVDHNESGKSVVAEQEESGKQPLVLEQSGARKSLAGKDDNQVKSVGDEEDKDLHGLNVDAAGEDEAAVAAVGDEGYAEEAGKAARQNSQTSAFESASQNNGSDQNRVAGVGPRVDSTQHTMAQQSRVDAAPAQPKLPPGLAQQTFQHISNSVLNGLKHNEHHLVLRLYPQQLGEVKVEMMVRDHHVSLSFGMENSRVKETLESNMQQFQDNLAKQGFTLQGCQVSVGQQQEDPNAAWQFFEQARQQGLGKNSRETLADLPVDSMYIRPIHNPGREGGISLFI